MYAVEARLFPTGMVITKVRPAESGETTHNAWTGSCEIWVDVFDSEPEARDFSRQYKKS